jgi:tetratricopeptide (TPR) repeat protein
VEDAIGELQTAVRLQPGTAALHFSLAEALWLRGSLNDAIAEYQRTVDLQPDHRDARYRLVSAAWVLTTHANPSIRSGARAVALASASDKFFHEQDPQIARVLAAAYAEDGRFPEAIETAQRALHLAITQSNSPLVQILQKEIPCYQTNTPLSRITPPNK